MKKILFISTRNPFSGRYSGDVVRSLKIVNFLKKKYSLDIVCLGKKGELKNKNMNILAFNDSNFFLKIFYCIVSLLKFEPIQFGLFYSREMKEYLREYAYQYDCLFFYHIRSSQYLPTNYRGKIIIEMGGAGVGIRQKNIVFTFLKICNNSTSIISALPIVRGGIEKRCKTICNHTRCKWCDDL